LELLSFNTLAERHAAFAERDSFWLEGTLRALMQIKDCDAEQAKELMQQCEAQQLTTAQFYGLLQDWLGNRMLVDKTPSYALDIEILRRAERDFAAARYLHLIRHPYAMIRSFEAARLEQVFFRYQHNFSRRELAELVWLQSQTNILQFLQTVPPERQHQVHFEELVTEPERVLRGVCQFLGLDYVSDMAAPYQDKAQRMVDGIHPLSKMLGDVKFHEHSGVEAAPAERWKQQLQPGDLLADDTCNMAQRLGYPTIDLQPPISSDGKRQRSGRQAREWSPLVEIQRGGDRPPLFFMHPGGGNISCYVELAHQLGSEQPFYGLQSRGLDENHVPLTLISDMACYYVETLRRRQPEGPYMLGGWSMGGLIAYEMAQQLRSRGEEISLLALLDSYPSSTKERRQLANTRSLLYTFALDLGVSSDDVEFLTNGHFPTDSEEQLLGRILEVAVTVKKLPHRVDRTQFQRFYNVFKSNAQAIRNYVPEKSSGRIALLKASERVPSLNKQQQEGKVLQRLLQQLRVGQSDPTRGWSKRAAVVELHDVPGNHFSLIRQPHVTVVAEKLRACILKTD